MSTDATGTRFAEYGPGEVVIKEGTRAHELFVLMSGRLDVSKNGTKIAEISARGSYVGEIAALLGCRRVATVTAAQLSKLMVIDNVTTFFEQNPASALGIAQTLAARIMDMNARIVTFRAELKRWVEEGQLALKDEDLAPLRRMLDEMERLLNEGRGTEKGT